MLNSSTIFSCYLPSKFVKRWIVPKLCSHNIFYMRGNFFFFRFNEKFFPPNIFYFVHMQANLSEMFVVLSLKIDD